jgi:holo-[acyl-carrier protein] synthase
VTVLVGCDLQPIDEVADAVKRFGQRYLDRTYTAWEQSHFQLHGAASLAGRFAGKEAVVKLLGLSGPLDHRTIEIGSTETGRPLVSLTGPAAAVAAARGISEIDLSLSHAGGLAMAVAVALTDP